MVKPLSPYPQPPTMPEAGKAQVYLPDAIKALQRASNAWNVEQVKDGIASAERFIALAKAEIHKQDEAGIIMEEFVCKKCELIRTGAKYRFWACTNGGYCEPKP